MFIFNSKHHCYNISFYDVLFTLLLAKNSYQKYKLFLDMLLSIPSAILSEIFIQNG